MMYDIDNEYNGDLSGVLTSRPAIRLKGLI